MINLILPMLWVMFAGACLGGVYAFLATGSKRRSATPTWKICQVAFAASVTLSTWTILLLSLWLAGLRVVLRPIWQVNMLEAWWLPTVFVAAAIVLYFCLYPIQDANRP
jgi:hypothetical protein